ncbi:MAG: hypothetical protein SFT68_01080 [Rickettsiaceae bacterium]|nr:hypothetical protein [Rickettsiaceae bacterium]
MTSTPYSYAYDGTESKSQNNHSSGRGPQGSQRPSSFRESTKASQSTTTPQVFWNNVKTEIDNNDIISRDHKTTVYDKLQEYINHDLLNPGGKSKINNFMSEVGKLHGTARQKSSPRVEMAMEELYTRVLNDFKGLRKTNSQGR